MDGGATGPLLDSRPCWATLDHGTSRQRQCGGDVILISGICRSCASRNVRPQFGPQSWFLACEADIVLFGGGAGGGKRLKIDEPVPSPDGWTTMGALVAGDVIYDEFGKPTIVTDAHPVDPSPESYRVTFDDGATIDACADHLWSARGQTRHTRELQPGDWMPVAPAVDGPCRIRAPDRPFRYVAGVESIEPVPMRCITVANPTGLYLVGERHLVTHNTFALLIDWLRHINTPGANGLIVRNRATDITIGGGLWDDAVKLYAGTGVRIRGGGIRDMTWPSGAKLSFRHLDDRNQESFKGPGFSWIGVEEANECSLSSIIYLLSRLRSTCGARPVMRLTCNPDPDHPIRNWVDPFYLDEHGYANRTKSGAIRWMVRSTKTDAFVFGATPKEAAEIGCVDDPAAALSFSFIPATLEDNPALALSDPSYKAKLTVQGAVIGEQLGKGNWHVKADVGGMLRRERWGGGEYMTEPIAPILRWVRSWDKAATKPRPGKKDPDYTVGVLMAWDIHGRFYVADVVACRDEPDVVSRLQATTAEADGIDVTQTSKISGGDTGKSDYKLNARVELLKGGGEVTSIKELKSKYVRVTPMSNALAMGMRGNRPAIDYELGPDDVWTPRGFLWNRGNWMNRPYEDGGEGPKTMGGMFWDQVHPFVNADKHDDIPDAMGDGFTVLSAVPVKTDVANRWANYTR